MKSPSAVKNKSDGRSRLVRYAQAKQALESVPMTPEQYEAMIRRITKRMGV